MSVRLSDRSARSIGESAGASNSTLTMKEYNLAQSWDDMGM
jgi:hypothetical protein